MSSISAHPFSRSMKVLLFAVLLPVTNAFVNPSNSALLRSPSFLRESGESQEVGVEFQGGAAISELTSGVKTVFSSEEISKLLPHRYPFLLVDKVVEYEQGKVGGQINENYVSFYLYYLRYTICIFSCQHL